MRELFIFQKSVDFVFICCRCQSASAQWKLDSLASGQQREKEEWRTRQKLLEQQLSNVKQECQ